MFKRDPGSFRDPSGTVFYKGDTVYRQINKVYMDSYRRLMDSGLHETLVKQRLIIPHKETDEPVEGNGALVIQPKRIPFISYPYEWCFGQYRAAALAMLRVQLLALQYGMSLKDASAYNIQFLNGYAVLIDTLSFVPYEENVPWVAYGQFCRHFVSPLLLMARVDSRLNKLMVSHIDGIPLDLADNILRRKSGFFGFWHIHLHSKAIARHGEDGKKTAKVAKVSKERLIAMVQSMLNYINLLTPKETITEWGDYYKCTNYSDDAAKIKEEIINSYLEHIGEFKTAWDFGANDGRYSRLALAKGGAHVVAFDIDHNAVERNYIDVKRSREPMLPLILDLTAPSPDIGFANIERGNIGMRQKPDVIFMLAVIHHLAISNNLPLSLIAHWISRQCRYVIIEFVPKEDSQTKLLLQNREDIFTNYNEEGFEAAFLEYFSLVKKQSITGSCRNLYLLACK